MAQHTYEPVTAIERNTRSLRFTSLITILWLVLLFNVNGIYVSGFYDGITLTPISYAVLIVVGLFTLALPDIAQISLLKLSIPILIVTQLLYMVFMPTSIGFDRLVIDGLALVITLLLLKQLVKNVSSAEDTLSSYSLTENNTHVLTYSEARNRVAEEADHLQQIGSPMAMIYCRLCSNNPDLEDQTSLDEVLLSDLSASFLSRFLQVRLARMIRGITYTSDILFEHGHAIAVCLSQTELSDAETFVHQLRGFISKSDDVTLWTSIVMFPKEAITLDEMLLKAQQRLKPFIPAETLPDDVSRAGDVYVSIPDRLRIEEKSEWVNRLPYQSPVSRAIYAPIKRTMDILVSGTALLILSPLLLLIALAIVISDGRPIFFSHKRVGLGGKTFMMHKFRSMYRNAPALEPKLVRLSDGSIRYDWPDKDEDDPRVTKIGRLLRKTSLDEVPQLWNVLTGSMSLIGPRPSSWTLEQHTLHQTARLTVKPGLTGLWQVSARSSKNFDERLLWDLKYVEKMGLWLDLQIVFRTFGVIINRTGV